MTRPDDGTSSDRALTETTGQRIAVALERLVVLMETKAEAEVPYPPVRLYPLHPKGGTQRSG